MLLNNKICYGGKNKMKKKILGILVSMFFVINGLSRDFILIC